MPNTPNRNEILPAVMAGMKSSARKWEKIHGTWANQAPEYWFTVNVSVEIFKRLNAEKCWIELEANVKNVLNKSRPKVPGSFRKTVRKNGKLDIVVERLREKPFAAIELKTCTQFFDKPFKADVHRLRDILLNKKSNTLKIGCIAVYTDKKGKIFVDTDKKKQNSAEVKLNKIFDTLVSGAKRECQETGLIIRHRKFISCGGDTTDRWGVLCITFQRS